MPIISCFPIDTLDQNTANSLYIQLAGGGTVSLDEALQVSGANLIEITEDDEAEIKELTGSAGQFVGFIEDDVVGAVDSPIPSGGTIGQVLTKTDAGTSWADNDGITQAEADERYLKLSEGVPKSRTVNGKPLDANISLSAADVGARGNDWVPSADEVGAATLDDVSTVKPLLRTVTLTTSGWSNGTQTVPVPGVLANETAQLIIPTPALASQTAYYDAGVRATGQAANSLTFTAKNSVPAANLTVYVTIQAVRA